MVLNYNLAEV
jgi:ribosomal protein S10